MHKPKTNIQIMDKVIQVQARQAGDDEYPRLWALVTSQNSQYTKYQRGIQRRIPIVVLRPST